MGKYVHKKLSLCASLFTVVIVVSLTLSPTIYLLACNITKKGGDARLGDRVLAWVKNTLDNRVGQLGDESINHHVTILDPLEIFGEDGALYGFSAGELRAPVFFFKPDDLPPKVRELQTTIGSADCFLVVSPEYNHIAPPALSSLMGHFGGSLYKCKPAGIVTYSPGPWGGMRASISIQVMCHELGCLPVSKLCGIPTVAECLNADGTPKDPANRMLVQLPELLGQLEWMAVAMKVQRQKSGTF